MTKFDIYKFAAEDYNNNAQMWDYDRKRLSGHPRANCKIEIYPNGAIALISYAELVIYIDGTGAVGCSGLWSATTRRHISWFLREYMPYLTFDDIKNRYVGGVVYTDGTKRLFTTRR